MSQNLTEVEHYLDQKLTGAFDFNRAGSALTDLVSGNQVPDFLESLLDEPDQLTRVATRSYRQQNGFDKLVLVSPSHRGYRLRFHIWNPKQDSPYQEDEHNHAWPFASVVVSGSFQQQFFNESERGALRHKHRFTYRFHGNSAEPFKDGYEAVYLGPTGLRIVHDAIMSVGSSYTLGPEVIHKATNPTDKPSATLFLNGPFQGSDSDVYSDRILEGRDRLDITYYQPDELANVIRNYLDSLGK